jgi:hypothetical protein
MPKGQTELNPSRLIFQWRSDKGNLAIQGEADCYHVAPHGNGYQIVGGPRAKPIATIRRFEPMPGQYKFMGKFYEWNAISHSFQIFNYEFADAKNCRSFLNQWIYRTCGDCEIIGLPRGRPRLATTKATLRKRETERRRRWLQVERFEELERQSEALRVARGDPIPTNATRDQLIGYIIEAELDREEIEAGEAREAKLNSN